MVVSSPLSKLVKTTEYDLHSDATFAWDPQYDGVAYGGNNVYETVKVVPFSVQNRDSKILVELNTCVYQYGGLTSVRLSLDGEIIRVAKQTQAEEEYAFVAAKRYLPSVAKGIHYLRIELRTSNAVPLEFYSDITDGSYLCLVVTELRK